MGCNMSRDGDDPNELPSMYSRPPTVVNSQQNTANQNPSQQRVQTREAKPEDIPQGPVVTREQNIEINEEKRDDGGKPSDDSESESDATDATDEVENTKESKENESSGDEDDKDTESSGDDDDKSDEE